MKLLYAVSLVILILASSSCSRDSAPPVSESDAREAIEKRIQNHMSDLVRLHSFRKTNGRDVMGMYAVEFVADVEFLDDCLWDNQFWAKRGQKGELGTEIEMKKGSREELSGAVFFERTDRGWVPNGE